MKVVFFVNIFILIVEKEFIIKNKGYRQSWAGDFWAPTSLEGLKGGYPEFGFLKNIGEDVYLYI